MYYWPQKHLINSSKNKINVFFCKLGSPGLFFYFRSFQTQFLQKKTVDVSWI